MARSGPPTTGHRGRVSLTATGTAALALAATVAPVPGAHAADTTHITRPALTLASGTTDLWVIGGSGVPIPSQSAIEQISERYIDPTAFPDFNDGNPMFAGQPMFPVDAARPLFTPEGLSPVIPGVKSLEFDPSLAQGIEILHQTIDRELAAGNHMVITGDSQGAVVMGQVMKDLMSLPESQRPPADALTFVMTGDEGVPNGGLLERFNLPGVPFSAPAFGITMVGATPADVPWHTVEYIGEYDGFADYPSYPINLLADINAVVGMGFVHLRYSDFSPEELAQAIRLPVSEGFDGDTDYFMIPQTLPLVQLLNLIPVVGKPLGDLLGPDLQILVNLGYGNIENGWDPGPFDVPTPFKLFPDLDLGEVFNALVDGAKRGWDAFLDDLPGLFSGSAFADPAESISGSISGLTDFVNTFTANVSGLYAGLLPLADFYNTLWTTLPAYDVSIFVNELSQGHLLEAIGMPIAANLGLLPPMVVFGLGGLANGVAEALGLSSLTDLVP